MSGGAAFWRVGLEVLEPAAAETAAPGAFARSTVSLIWGRDHLSFDDRAGRRVVLDFQQRRRRIIDGVAGTFTDDPLFVEVGIRHFELPNREHIRKVIEAGGGDGRSFAPLRVEHQLSLRPPTSGTRLIAETRATSSTPARALRTLFRRPSGIGPDDGIVVQDRGRRAVYTHEGQPLVTYERAPGLEVPGDVLAQFMRYRWGCHPLILADIAQLDFMPREIEIHGLEPAPFDRGTVTVKATSAVRAAGDQADTVGLRMIIDPERRDPLDALLVTPTAGSDAGVIAERLAEARALIATGDALDGMIRFFELTLEANVALARDMAEAFRSSPDPRVAELMASLRGAEDAASAREALAVHARVRGRSTRPQPVLDVFEAELLSGLGERNRAKELLGRALAANPRLVGAYKALGDLYMIEFQGHHAWRCWERARSLCPGHPVLRPVAALEQTLLGSYPEYFAAPTVPDLN
jgi:hypothetical protein